MGRFITSVLKKSAPTNLEVQQVHRICQLMQSCTVVYEALTSRERRCITQERMSIRMQVNMFRSVLDLKAYVNELHAFRRASEPKTVPFAFSPGEDRSGFFHVFNEDSMIGMGLEGDRVSVELLTKIPDKNWYTPVISLCYEKDKPVQPGSMVTLGQIETDTWLKFKAVMQTVADKGHMPDPEKFKELNQILQAKVL